MGTDPKNDEPVMQSLRLATAINVAANALSEFDPEKLEQLHQKYLTSVKNNWMEGLEPATEVLATEECILTVEAIFALANKAKAAKSPPS